ncbi:MAG: hypothetical protein FWF10_11960 [Clostridiales bacterium]|nr:hypothetical protein [Clostridiales bacterium]
MMERQWQVAGPALLHYIEEQQWPGYLATAYPQNKGGKKNAFVLLRNNMKQASPPEAALVLHEFVEPVRADFTGTAHDVRGLPSAIFADVGAVFLSDIDMFFRRAVRAIAKLAGVGSVPAVLAEIPFRDLFDHHVFACG